MRSLKSVILAGGVGTRLWPLSRTHYPKQFLKLEGNSLFQETYLRSLKLSSPDEILVVTNEVHQYLVKSQIEELRANPSDDQILKEPEGKNTLPAITWAMHEIRSKFGESEVVIFPSDHKLEETATEEIAAATGIGADYLVTFGIRPTHPDTGYGYIASGEGIPPGYLVHEFKEKPDRITAEHYVKSGYLWNSGIFLFSTGRFFSEMQEYQPEFLEAFEENTPDYDRLPPLSVDYGLLEKSCHVAVVPLKARWTDLGTFQAWYEYRDHDLQGNSGEAEYLDSVNNFVYAPGKEVALIGISNSVVVDTGDALLVAETGKSGRVNEIVRRYKAKGDPIVDYPLQVYRPWGSYVELERSRFFRIKRLTVKPGEQLSLQKHLHRSEHWIVVSGMADVQLAGKKIQVRRGESTYVPEGMKHRLGNSGKIPLEVIEVQIGEYLEEDDIIRFNDRYNRRIE
ncbi:MAG TPA: mannose-1-phosphate guanylyltransferase/mannose-6-phosphate isomerase [Methanoregulaceae archaeon]|nr:mannose-1-phosphate guanylyltransferase/mannose-6-phosphate isomerase [Methanoregulaceae archaeon]